MKKSFSKVLVVIAGAISAACVFAQGAKAPPAVKQASTPQHEVVSPADAAKEVITPASVPTGMTFRQLDTLRSENAILKAKLENAELKSKIENAGKNPANMAGSPMGAPAMMQGGYGATPSSPQVLMVSGVGDKLTAVISLPGGRQVYAKVGSYIKGVGRIKSISADEVLLRNNSAIPFAHNEAGVSNTQQHQQMAPRMPGS